MTIQQQVVSLDLAKRLKELGVKQESLFYISNAGTILHNPPPKPLESCSAFTVAEILNELPSTIEGKSMFIDRFHDKWLVGYCDIYDDDVPYMDTCADACAELFVYLLESNLLPASHRG